MPQITVDDHHIALTNLDKVIYPDTGTTKGDVVDYYHRIAPAMLPHIDGRPATRKRWPNGVTGQSFFEKNAAESTPGWITQCTVQHKSRTVSYPIFDSVAALVWAGQQAALELHVPQWRFDAESQRGPATRLVFDLDPGDGVTLPQCAEVARSIRDLVQNLGWTTLPVTSGSKGIHLYVELDRTLDSSGASTVAKQVAASLEKMMPKLVTATMAKSARADKVFVDWSQNNAAKTTVAPYSLRGRSHPLVAAPRTWEELEDPDLRQLRFDEVLARYETDGDLLAELDPVRTDSPDPLSVYRSKRSASKTPEPVPDSTPAVGNDNTFVIQEHHARALHYDFRLEHDGVMVSWAVPKNVPTSTGQNRLAVHTEDHPLEYATFAGTIPKGEYGGGEVSIWDSGTYTAEKWRDDEVIMTLEGQQVKGRFALIRTKGDQWLMHLMKDQQPSQSQPSQYTDEGSSFPRGLAPMLATPESGDGVARKLSSDEWAFEGKWDGIRVIAEFHDGGIRLRTRNDNDVTDRYRDLASLADVLDGHDCVLDGEVVVLDSKGITNFGLLQNGGSAEFYAFDVLHLDGTSLLRKKYSDRRRVLEALAQKVDGLVVPPPLSGNGEEALEESRRNGWEGVVAKRRDSVYLPGKRGSAWMKVKNWLTQEVVIGGWRPGEGGRAGGIGSLILGVPGEDGLAYVGRVGTGFTERDRDHLSTLLKPRERKTSPFSADLPADVAKGAHWVTPNLVGEVRFMEWTGSGRLRHPSWRGLRDDKSPDDVARE